MSSTLAGEIEQWMELFDVTKRLQDTATSWSLFITEPYLSIMQIWFVMTAGTWRPDVPNSEARTSCLSRSLGSWPFHSSARSTWRLQNQQQWDYAETSEPGIPQYSQWPVLFQSSLVSQLKHSTLRLSKLDESFPEKSWPRHPVRLRDCWPRSRLRASSANPVILFANKFREHARYPSTTKYSKKKGECSKEKKRDDKAREDWEEAKHNPSFSFSPSSSHQINSNLSNSWLSHDFEKKNHCTFAWL